MQTGWTVSLHLSEIGTNDQFPFQASAGLTLTAFKPQSPAVAPTPDLVVKGAVDTGSDVIFCVPSFVEVWYHQPFRSPVPISQYVVVFSFSIKAWAKNQEYIRLLQKTEGIVRHYLCSCFI